MKKNISFIVEYNKAKLCLWCGKMMICYLRKTPWDVLICEINQSIWSIIQIMIQKFMFYLYRLHKALSLHREKTTHRMRENICKWSGGNSSCSLVSKKQTAQSKNEPKIYIDISPKKTYIFRRLQSTWKDAQYH